MMMRTEDPLRRPRTASAEATGPKITGAAAAALLAVSLAAGCGRTPESVSNHKPGTYRGKPWIMATPNPVPAGRGPATTTVSWDTGKGTTGQVFVSVNGGPETFFSGNDSCHEYVPSVGWYEYEYRLYDGEPRVTPLAKVTVRRKAR